MTSPQVRVVHLPAAVLEALAEDDLATASALAPVALTPWVADADNLPVWRMRATQVADTPQDLAWVTGLVLDGDRVVGAGGFHAAPDDRGMVEAGYRIDPEHRRRGYGRATLQHLLDRARRDPDVSVLRLTISPDNLPSLAMAAPFGFAEVGEQWDEEDGLETIFELDVSASS